ncbi:MotA/TolQ/ExbB proton channel family protein [Uliginosibacterium aquaticum]|uniref:MotA/TolQ/ExbB proton channel family protein n=1 Tax=Uliginosibacterium aquaticum TaxID=2731212 RepID=A0ABX2IHU8_9RHOO|nr:MotA/TolQ/ExbB proton channel family protein [Uliginosibacterium aquaticum]NSL56339.1 MotA/TolQ/ExbB proton channel family protein [Uliginosibacterium aquaticum]
MNFNLLHEIVLAAMVVLLALAVAVIIERFIYYSFVERTRKRLGKALASGDSSAIEAAVGVARTPHGRIMAGVLAFAGASKDQFENKVQALYLQQQSSVKRLLWVIDTTITLSPLLGLLGTILGIIDTFNALATQGVSDPQAVSQGIGTALFATAAGIGIAVFCLVFHNYFNERVERINEQLKVMALEQAGAMGGEEMEVRGGREPARIQPKAVAA